MYFCMSGHSHFSTIKHKKEAEDQKRGRIFSKLSRVISVAAKIGEDPETNPKLRQALDEAKRFNMPKENIERAIKKGTGEMQGEKLEEITYEAFGPGNIVLILEGITDNKNRALSEIKQILQKHGGKLAELGSIKWMFEKKGLINVRVKCAGHEADSQISNVKNKEELELLAIDAGAEDVQIHNDLLNIYTKSEELEKVKNNLKNKQVTIESSSLEWIAKEKVQVLEKDKEKVQKLFEELDENDAIQNIFSNLKI